MDFIPKPKRSSAFGIPDPVDDGSTKRPQDPLVASVMEEDQARKKAKKGDTVVGEHRMICLLP